ncbi:GNAT family N-acetyltransferase [Gluconobacter wancherniae]|uniref:GNAT family N-acetyltransferase n=1 Tax=Gluconobacter wancherniae TaxID=1307955 RepID=UPI001B8B9C95|nr:GNAT family N-acetyltransferase [Gluconobacter wancherniae]MBS1088314.1 N-acetyltransferase [Gluconobacter wancherniae]
MAISIRDANLEDLPSILAITNHAIENTDAIWLNSPFTLEARRNWFDSRRADGFPVLVACDSTGSVLGFGSYGHFRAYEGYSRTIEHSVYVAPAAQRLGIGQKLLSALIAQAQSGGFQVMVAAITAGNEASIAMHRKAGFLDGGLLPRVGRKSGRWLDLNLMYLPLDPQSETAKDNS